MVKEFTDLVNEVSQNLTKVSRRLDYKLSRSRCRGTRNFEGYQCFERKGLENDECFSHSKR